jgi:hypothetical protein
MHVKNMLSNSKLFNTALFFSVLGLFIILVSFAVPRGDIAAFAWLFFYLPSLWILWIACVFFARLEKRGRNLFCLWILIDLSALLLFSSFALRVDNWSHSRGVEVAVLATYFPVVMPMLFGFTIPFSTGQVGIFGSLDAFTELLGSRIGDAVAIWIFLSVVAVVQSACIFTGSRLLQRARLANIEKIEPVRCKDRRGQ